MDGSHDIADDAETQALDLLRQAVGLLADARRRREQVAEKLVTAEQLADLLAVPVSAVEAKARSGELPAVRFGRYVRFEPRVVLEALRTEAGPQ
jgi:excisionase family DNA binding protein